MRLVLLLIIAISFYQCRINPTYLLDDIQGDWVRVGSNDYRSDGMRINITDDSSTIIDVPASSTFIKNATKWTNIQSTVRDLTISRGDFILYDFSSDGNPYEATMFLKEDTIFLINLNFPNTLGGVQAWVKI